MIDNFSITRDPDEQSELYETIKDIINLVGLFPLSLRFERAIIKLVNTFLIECHLLIKIEEIDVYILTRNDRFSISVISTIAKELR